MQATTIPEARRTNRPRHAKAIAWAFGLTIAVVLFVVPIVYYRHSYTHSKRLREVAAGKLYRSGCMTAPGFRAAIERYGIKTIVNLQDEAPDPDLPRNYLGLGSERESELCDELGVRFIAMTADLVNRRDFPAQRPQAIDAFLRIMDDPANYPVLVHCRAGLHRTGCLMAVYRMEYDAWTKEEAIRELRRMGFGRFSTSANDYIIQYILGYQRGLRKGNDDALLGSQATNFNGQMERIRSGPLQPALSHASNPDR